MREVYWVVPLGCCRRPAPKMANSTQTQIALTVYRSFFDASHLTQLVRFAVRGGEWPTGITGATSSRPRAGPILGNANVIYRALTWLWSGRCLEHPIDAIPADVPPG